ncbi:hypothetical protein OCK02_21905 [Rhizobium sp. TRM96647]|uniref:hypothetical protein n=1 Tax=unclassified Rhizobium TaxID=2613769 RepID=UPI001E62309E|nr:MULTISPECIES: hypothetical protein [unclassified Rhizobium]MCD2185011.1 hypothetical protein [Rhizobium sp. GN54]MCV3738844.1 hypothetical protein [Rhizobium sp. TRM96647]MCV3760449.1 hypothetical protein [Rhizobium sp. TRM96650]
MADTDKVIAQALAAVAASKALRERLLARRAEAQKRLEAPPRPVYVRRKAGTQLRLPLQ